MAVMARREADTPLSGRVEMDDAYLGGARAGGILARKYSSWSRSRASASARFCAAGTRSIVGNRAIRTGSGRQAARMAPFKWVNTTLGNIKSAITASSAPIKRYLHASFAWRYNRRYQLNTMIPRFVHSAARTQPIPYRALIAG